ncbi:MAG: hypothetical protein AAFN77_01140 [Planctomycetota bacterium]
MLHRNDYPTDLPRPWAVPLCLALALTAICNSSSAQRQDIKLDPFSTDQVEASPSSANSNLDLPKTSFNVALKMDRYFDVKTDERYELSFLGGSLGELISMLKRHPIYLERTVELEDGSTTIKRVETTLNVVVTESAKNFMLPEIQVTTNTQGVLNLLDALGGPDHQIMIQEMTQDNDDVIFVVDIDTQLESEVAVINAKQLLETIEETDMLSAIEIGFQMQGRGGSQVELKLHKETGLLFVRGTYIQTQLVNNVIRELHASRGLQTPNRGGGAEGMMGGIGPGMSMGMGGGGFGGGSGPASPGGVSGRASGVRGGGKFGGGGRTGGGFGSAGGDDDGGTGGGFGSAGGGPGGGKFSGAGLGKGASDPGGPAGGDYGDSKSPKGPAQSAKPNTKKSAPQRSGGGLGGFGDSGSK